MRTYLTYTHILSVLIICVTIFSIIHLRHIINSLTNEKNKIVNSEYSTLDTNYLLQDKLLVYNYFTNILHTNKVDFSGSTIIYCNNEMCGSCIEECIMDLNILLETNKTFQYKLVLDSICYKYLTDMDFFANQKKRAIIWDYSSYSFGIYRTPIIVLYDNKGTARMVKQFKYFHT
ncbi:hypothetical protein LX69_02675 [Breznakibacter xylanolyticus]|uniref:Uncharacterized protein n=1 Tax=Breznakibacter xylanolyticus TaxID=990 RepID=A0A2W7PV81_9BACT|nr:hypothetical protein LX69_02675 [Breznakibacter xylanolyticus]